MATVAKENPKLRVADMGFPKEKLAKASDRVKNMTVKDLRDMDKIFTAGAPVKNATVQNLNAEDLKSLEDLFGTYRQQVIQSFANKPSLGASFSAKGELEAEWSVGSCCCSPCCCCAAAETDPFLN